MIVGEPENEAATDWYDDIPMGDPTFDEVEPALAIAPDGKLFVAVEQHGTTHDGWIRVYRSTDAGYSWVWLIGIHSGTVARNPAIAYAERATGENWVYVAYEATMADSTKRIMVFRFDPDEPLDNDFVTAATDITGTPDIHPRICTDNRVWDTYYVYVTYIVNGVDANFTMFTRSLDNGLTYSTPANLTGGSEVSSFVPRPDIAFGSAGLFVAFEKPGWSGSVWETQVWVTRSTNFGGSWSTLVQLTASDAGAWHPSVAAAVGVSTVMVAFTQSDGSQTDIDCACSTNGGTSYGSPTSLPWTFDEEKSVALAVSDGGGRYQAAFWRNYDVRYTSTDAASPLPWAGTTLINEANWASSTYSRPAIAVDTTQPARRKHAWSGPTTEAATTTSTSIEPSCRRSSSTTSRAATSRSGRRLRHSWLPPARLRGRGDAAPAGAPHPFVADREIGRATS